MNPGGRIVIFTVGFHARATYRHLARRSGTQVLGFVDNNPAVQGTTRFGLPVWSPKRLREIAFDFVAVPGRAQPAIVAQLRDDFGVAAERIWIVRKSEVLPAADELARRGAALAGLLRRVDDVLRANAAGYWAMHSSLLGLLRAQELALFSDVDLCVTAEGFAALPERFAAAGVAVAIVATRDGAAPAEIGLQIPAERAGEEPALVDLHPLTLGPVEATWLVNGRALELPARHFIGRGFVAYRGCALPVPLDAPGVLAALYGEDWRQPAETWNGRYAVTAAAAPIAA